MAQRCSLCGKTEKQHGGRACFTVGLTRVTGQTTMLESEAQRIENAPSDEPDDRPFDDNYDQDFGWNDDHSEDENGDPNRQTH